MIEAVHNLPLFRLSRLWYACTCFFRSCLLRCCFYFQLPVAKFAVGGFAFLLILLRSPFAQAGLNLVHEPDALVKLYGALPGAVSAVVQGCPDLDRVKIRGTQLPVRQPGEFAEH